MRAARLAEIGDDVDTPLTIMILRRGALWLLAVAEDDAPARFQPLSPAEAGEMCDDLRAVAVKWRARAEGGGRA